MTINPPEAAAALDDIEIVIERVKQSEIYRNASLLLMMWGGIVACAYLATYFVPRQAPLVWLVFQSAGLLATIVISRRFSRGRRGTSHFRLVGAMLLFVGFGLLWSAVLGKFGQREMNAFWASLFMFGFTMAGLWFGRAFIALGLTITALTMVGYFWAGSLFEPYMAVVNGGGLVMCGLMMRRA